MSVSTDNSVVYDGFHDLFRFKEHRLQVRGFNLLDLDDGKESEFNTRHHILSWDNKQVYLWQNDTKDSKPRVMHQIRSSSSQSCCLCSIVLVSKMKVFLGAALDMTFKIYDKKLNLLEVIRHEERAILHLEYDAPRDLIISAGACGVGVWRLYRHTSLDSAHIVEKLYTFEGCSHWVSKVIYEPQSDRIYAIQDSSVQVLTFARRGVAAELNDIHDSPVNVACWYNRNQFYITGCRYVRTQSWGP